MALRYLKRNCGNGLIEVVLQYSSENTIHRKGLDGKFYPLLNTQWFDVPTVTSND